MGTSILGMIKIILMVVGLGASPKVHVFLIHIYT
jgi:hypothetical protein